MINQKLINPKNTIVLVIDVQNDYCSEKGKLAIERNVDVKPVQRMVSKLIRFIELARDFGLPIVFVRMNKDIKQVDESLRVKLQSLGSPLGSSLCVPGTWGFEYYKIKPEQGDVEIIKKSYDAFSNPELDKLLKKWKIKNLIITGAYTAICIDATLKSGFSKGYNVVIPEDLVSTTKETMYQQDAIVDVWKAIFAHVVKSEELIESWKSLKSKIL